MIHLTIIESDNRDEFVERFEDFANLPTVFILDVKFQRNLFYSLSGSTHLEKERVRETSTLKEGYVAFVRWSDVKGA